MRVTSRVGFACLIAFGAVNANEPLSYNRDIRPILSENCFQCHGFDEHARKGKLRLDVRDDVLRQRDDGAAIVPGKPDESVLWKRIISTDADDIMPPPESHRTLSAEDKARLREWIQQGAIYEPHWAFIAPRKVSPSSNDKPSIDVFVRERLRKAGLEPAAEADRATLIRRVSLDLTGLAPSAEEIEAFVRDPALDAYARVVDRLLASQQFGERMALEWLDAARYADTNGYSIDGSRDLWIWRDWVIQSFNDNLPYNRFIIEQIAGDLLPQRSESQLIATGFQRNNMNTHEGGTIPEENLVNYNADRVKTLGESMLGLTLSCAQCHDHKFDPVSQRDYYRIFAYFNTLGDAGLDGSNSYNSHPIANVRTPLKNIDLEAIRSRIAGLKHTLETPNNAVLTSWADTQRARLAERGRGLELHPISLTRISTPNVGSGFNVDGNSFSGLGGAAYDILGKLPDTDKPITGIRLVFPKRDFILTAIDVTIDAVPGDQVNLHRLQRFQQITASSWRPEHPAADVQAFANNRGWSPDPNVAESHITLTFEQPIDASRTPWITTQVNCSVRAAGTGKMYAITGKDDGIDIPEDIIAILAIPNAKHTPEQTLRLWKVCAQQSAAMRAARVDLANAQERLRVFTEPQSTMVMNVSAKPRITHILARGDYTQPREVVDPGVPSALPPLPKDAPANRLGLAQWMVMAENPLTARVAVNRTWKMFFGTGIVTTASDFGLQGALPTHPELLDWLAVDFVESSWDIKRLVRTIVMSGTYRQSSHCTVAQLEKDPFNQLLARGPRFRLPAELIRDNALRASGLLVRDIGGPSVNPYSPFDLWREVSHYPSTLPRAQTFVQDHGDKLYRRSLYTYWKRTAPPANLSAFDAPNREVCTVTRGSTNTPLQALVLLNDVQFTEAARFLAERILDRKDNDERRLRWAALEVLSRPLTEQELSVLKGTLQRERERYTADPAKAQAALKVGESPRNPRHPAPEHAAWYQVSALLLNLSETITRN